MLGALFWNFFKIERKNIKFKAGLLLMFAIVGATVIMLHYSDFNLMDKQIDAETVSINSGMMQFRKIDATDPDVASPLYMNLAKQVRALGKIKMGIVMQKDEVTVDTAINLNQLRLDSFELEEFEKVENFIPEKYKVLSNLTFYDTIKKQEKPLYTDSNQNFPSFVLLLMTILGVIWYLFCGILSSDILLNDQEHLSIVRNYPISDAGRMTVKILNYLTICLVYLIIVLGSGLAVGHLIYGSDFQYPMMMYLSNFQAVSIINYLLIGVCYFLLLSFIAVTISILVSQWLKNIYIVMFIHFAIFFIIELIPNLVKSIWFLPTHYFNYTTVMSGRLFQMSGQPLANISSGFMILSLLTIVLFLIIYIKFYRGNALKKGGRQ